MGVCGKSQVIMTLITRPWNYSTLSHCRLSEQAQRQLQDSEKFEDILLGASRATVVIQRYEELYSQERMETLDAIEALQLKSSHMRSETPSTAAMDASDTFNVRLLLDVFKVG